MQDSGITPLHLAVKNEFADVVRALMETGKANPNIPTKIPTTKVSQTRGQ